MPYLMDKSSGSIYQTRLGATRETGGTRGRVITVGGDNTLPFQSYEGVQPLGAVIAAEILDSEPKAWPDTLEKAWGACLSSPAAWAKEAVARGADMVYLKLMGLDPDHGGRSVDECAAVLGEVLRAVDCPVGVQGCDNDEYDRPLITRIAEEYKGENLLIGLAKQSNYATYAASCISNGHSLIASSPLDINLCKQLNILISDMNMPLDRIVIDPSIGALGYGLEYAYSILERGRIGALQGDRMLAMPVIAFVGAETWKVKESIADTSEFPKWGDKDSRGIIWETVTATALLQSGAHILVTRHPEAMKAVREYIDDFMTPVL